MPYKYNDTWHRDAREYIRGKVEAGRIGPGTEDNYKRWFHQAWEVLGEKAPLEVTLRDLERLEASWKIGQNTKASRLRVIREFLRQCGNKQALKWYIRAVARPKEDRVFLSEAAVEDIRLIARSMGPESELIFSLGVDNSLRAGDQARITLDEAKELLWKGQSVITCKGRNKGKRRLLVMSLVTRAPLRAYLAEREKMVAKYGHDPGNLFLTDHNGKLKNMTSKGVGYRVKKISWQVGTYFRSHDQRATFGNRHWNNKEDLLTIAAMMGIENPNLAFRCYIGVSQGDQRAAQDRLAKRKRRPRRKRPT